MVMSSQSTALPVCLVLYLAMIAQNAWMLRYHQHRSHRHQVRKLRDPHCTTIVLSVNIYQERANFELGEYVYFAHTGHLRVYILFLRSALPVQLVLFLAMIDRNVWMLLLTERCFLLSNIQQFSMCIPCTSNSDPICAVHPPSPRST